jgi:class 3 adenylate cyclase
MMEVRTVTDAAPGGVLVPAIQAPWFGQPHYMLGRDKTRIGRAPDCQVRVNHPNVSRHHLELAWVKGALVATHLSSSGTTNVNGVPISGLCDLKSGDEIEIAEGVRLRLQIFDASEDSPTATRPFAEHRLLAVVHADVVSYSRLVEDSEEATARQFQTCLDMLRSEISEGGGRIDNIAGDSLLIVFKSAHAAVLSTLRWQMNVASLNETLPPHRPMQFRAGINLGDVLIAGGGALYGETVNIAARLQQIAPAKGTLVTGVVRDQLQGDERFEFLLVGSRELKNISREVRIFEVRLRV